MHLLSQMVVFGIYVKFQWCSKFAWPYLRDLQHSVIRFFFADCLNNLVPNK